MERVKDLSISGRPEMSGLYAKIETLRKENEWLREENALQSEEITRLQDLAFDRAAEIAALHGDEEE